MGREVTLPCIPSLRWVYPGGYLTFLPIYLAEKGSPATVLLDSSDSEHSAAIQQN